MFTLVDPCTYICQRAQALTSDLNSEQVQQRIIGREIHTFTQRVHYIGQQIKEISFLIEDIDHDIIQARSGVLRKYIETLGQKEKGTYRPSQEALDAPYQQEDTKMAPIQLIELDQLYQDARNIYHDYLDGLTAQS